MEAMTRTLLDSLTIPAKDHLHIVEIGTGYGDGTTAYIHAYFTARGTPFTLHSYEGVPDCYAKASARWKTVPNVEIIPKFFCNKRDIRDFVLPNCRDDAPPLTREHYIKDYASILQTGSFVDTLSYIPDIVVIDVWRFCHVAVVKKLAEVCSPETQIIMEDDFKVYGETEILQSYFSLLDLKRFDGNGTSEVWNFISFRLIVPEVLYYNHLPLLADHILDFPRSAYGTIKPKHNYPTFVPSAVQARDVVFVKTDLLPLFFRDLFPRIRAPFYLLTGVAGLDVSPTFQQYLDSPLIIKWIGCNLWEHPKAFPIPIGFEENERRRGGEAEGEGGDQDTLRTVLATRKPFEEKINRLLVTYLGKTHATRAAVLDPLQDKDFVDYAPKLPFHEYMERINDYRFVLCPRGAGTDTHRFWEVLLAGSIPVLERNGLSHLYSQFPCILVNSLSELTQEHLDSFVVDPEKEARILQYLRIRDFNALIRREVGR